MSFVNFKLPDGKTYSVDFVVFSDQHRIADSGYHLLPVTETALAESTETYTDAAAWATANAAIFANAVNVPQGDSA